MSELSKEISAARERHPEACDAAKAMLDAAALHQRISELEKERDAWRECAEKLATRLERHLNLFHTGLDAVDRMELASFDKLNGEMK